MLFLLVIKDLIHQNQHPHHQPCIQKGEFRDLTYLKFKIRSILILLEYMVSKTK